MCTQLQCPPTVSELTGLKNFSTAVEATLTNVLWNMTLIYIVDIMIDYLLIVSFSCSQHGRTAVLLAAGNGHLDLVRELVEQHRADLLHKSKVSCASFCV